MSTDNTNPQGSAARHRAWIAAWVIFLAAIFSYGWYHARQVEQFHLETTRWHYALAKYQERSTEEVIRVRELLAVPFGKPGSQREAERIVNRGQPFDLRKQGDLDVTNWHDPDHLVQISMEFRDGVLVGLSVSGEDGSFSKRNPAPTPLWTKLGETWRRRFIRIAVWTWIVAGATWLIPSRHRLMAAQAMLAAASVAGAALAVHPGYSISWQGVFSNDHLFYALVMLVISVIALARTLRRQSSRSSFRVQFGLRHALIAITILAILLAAGPFGYFTLAVAIFGITLFAAVYIFKRSPVTAHGEQWQGTATSHQNLK